MVSSICDGFMSDGNKVKEPCKTTVNPETGEVKVVSVDTVKVNKVIIDKVEFTKLPRVDAPDVSSDLNYNEAIVAGLSKVEVSVNNVEEAVKNIKIGSGSLFGSFFKGIGKVLFSPIKTIKEMFKGFFEKSVSSFKSLGGFIKKLALAPFKLLGSLIKTTGGFLKSFFKKTGGFIKKIGGFVGKGLMAPFKLIGKLFGFGNKDSTLISLLTTQYEEQKEVLAVRHTEIIDALVDIKKAIKGEDEVLSGAGALGIGAGIGAALSGAGKLFSKFFGGIKSGLKLITSPLGKLGELFGKVKDSFLKAFGKGGSVRNLIGRFLKNPFGKLGALGLAGFIGSEIGKFVNDVLVPDDVKKSIGNAIGPHIDKIVGFFSGISGFFKEKFDEINPGEVWENLKKNIMESFSSISDFFDSPIANLKKMFSEEESAEVKAEVPKVEEPSILGFGKYLIDKTLNSFEETIKVEKPQQVETPILSNVKQLNDLQDFASNKNSETANVLGSTTGQLEAAKESIFRIERQETIQKENDKKAMKMLQQQSKASNISISSGEKGRSLDNSPVASNDLGLVLVLGGGI